MDLLGVGSFSGWPSSTGPRCLPGRGVVWSKGAGHGGAVGPGGERWSKGPGGRGQGLRGSKEWVHTLCLVRWKSRPPSKKKLILMLMNPLSPPLSSPPLPILANLLPHKITLHTSTHLHPPPITIFLHITYLLHPLTHFSPVVSLPADEAPQMANPKGQPTGASSCNTESEIISTGPNKRLNSQISPNPG